MSGLRRILVATDFDATSDAVVHAAAAVARATDASVLEALMYSSPEMAAQAERDRRTHPEATRKMADAVGQLRDGGVKDANGSIEYGIAVDVLLRHANAGKFDLLIIGSRRHGSTAAYVIPRSKIPVMTVPSVAFA